MLSKPSAGWSRLEYEDFSFPVSYLTDVPNDIIKALTIALRENVSTAVDIDGESEGTCTILFNVSENCVSVIFCSQEYEIGRVEKTFYELNILKFAKEIISDFERDHKEWTEWFCDEEEKCIYDLTELKNIVKEKE